LLQGCELIVRDPLVHLPDGLSAYDSLYIELALLRIKGHTIVASFRRWCRATTRRCCSPTPA
jgi:hypothetical protein